jgi:hypothetical protein
MAVRPKVERVSRSVRLPAALDADLVVAAELAGRSVNAEIEVRLAHSLATAGHAPPPPLRMPTKSLAAPGDTQSGTGVAQARRAGKPPRSARAPEPCSHPKDKERKLAYGVFCGECNTRIR